MHLLPAATSLLSLAAFSAGLTYPDNTPPPGIDVWCGKAYRATAPAFSALVDKGWQPFPAYSPEPLLEFSCRPRRKPYIAGEPAVFVVDARISHDVGTPLSADTVARTHTLLVTITDSSGAVLSSAAPVPVSDTPTEVSVSLSSLSPGTAPRNITCTAFPVTDAGAEKDGDDAPLATATAALYYLPPNPYGGSTVQVDSLTDELVVVDGTAGTALPERFFPVGYFNSWGGFLQMNFSRLGEIRDSGFTIVHPIPGGGTAEEAWGSMDQIVSFMKAAAEVGLWVMYDMRHTYQSPADLTTHLASIRSLPSLLTWYTADEPDGNNHPTASPLTAYTLISELDGYHPVSLVLNCQNYFFAQYASGADIVAPDIYPIGTNLTFSSVYATPCNRTYGDCGCDNCGNPTAGARGEGDSGAGASASAGTGTAADAPPAEDALLSELASRLGYYHQLARAAGMRKTFWATSQALGQESFWTRYPTAAETQAMAMRAVRQGGARGLLWWMQPTDAGVYQATARVAREVNKGVGVAGRGERDEGGSGEEEVGGGGKETNDGTGKEVREGAEKREAEDRQRTEKESEREWEVEKDQDAPRPAQKRIRHDDL